MSEQESIDIGKVIGIIMENPQLIEQIASLAKQSTPSTNVPEEAMPAPTEIAAKEDVVPTATTPTYKSETHGRSNRAQLLGALKPYVSEDRAKAIDSMISIADILDMMKAR